MTGWDLFHAKRRSLQSFTSLRGHTRKANPKLSRIPAKLQKEEYPQNRRQNHVLRTSEPCNGRKKRSLNTPRNTPAILSKLWPSRECPDKPGRVRTGADDLKQKQGLQFCRNSDGSRHLASEGKEGKKEGRPRRKKKTATH